MKPRIIISSGHSLTESGAVYAGYRETDINMAIRDCVKRLIPDCIVVPDTLSLTETVEWIKSFAGKDDLALEIHCNFNNNLNISGVESYFSDDYGLAEIFSRNVAREIDLPNRGARSDTESAIGKLYFLRSLNCHSILLECGYMSNPIDRQKLLYPSTHEKIAMGIKKAIDEWQGKNQIKLKILELYQEVYKLMLKLYEQKIRGIKL